MTLPRSESLTPGPRRFGPGVAIIVALLSGPSAQSGGCARCGGSTPAVTYVPRLNPPGSHWLRPHRPFAWDEVRPQRWTREAGTGAVGGSYFVCVRVCDGGFFPVSYIGDRGSLAKICQALCPNAETQLYSMPFGGTIEESVSASGLPYASLPNAGKFDQAVDQDCSCRRKGQGWAEALAGVEVKLQRHSGDILVTPEISEQMSQPAKAPEVSAAPAHATDADGLALAETPEPQALALDVDGVDLDLKAATAAVSRDTSGIGVEETEGGAHYGLNQGQVVEQKGPDGLVKRVRIVAPTLY